MELRLLQEINDATSFGAGVLTEMQFNEGDGAGSEYFGKVKQLQVYKTALTDTTSSINFII